MKNNLLFHHPLFTRWVLILGLVFTISLVVAEFQPLWGQEEDAAAAPAPVDSALEGTNLFTLFNAGGWAMYPLLFLSMMGVGLSVFNVLNLLPKNFYGKSALPEIKAAMENLDIETARTLCEGTPSMVTNITLAGLDRIDDSVNLEAVEKAMEEASSEELSGPFLYINLLSIVGSVAPMMGMLGTVSGMIGGFRALAAQGMGDPSTLADAISEALITTATGLIVGIPAMVAYFVFKSIYGVMASRVARYSGDLYYGLVTGTQRSLEQQDS